jgi:hypothetical protein
MCLLWMPLSRASPTATRFASLKMKAPRTGRIGPSAYDLWRRCSGGPTRPTSRWPKPWEARSSPATVGWTRRPATPPSWRSFDPAAPTRRVPSPAHGSRRDAGSARHPPGRAGRGASVRGPRARGDEEPLIRCHAAWALGRIGSAERGRRCGGGRRWRRTPGFARSWRSRRTAETASTRPFRTARSASRRFGSHAGPVSGESRPRALRWRPPGRRTGRHR